MLFCKIEDIDVGFIIQHYLPEFVKDDAIVEDTRSDKEKLAAIHLFDREHDCPTFAAIILFGINPRYFLPGDYIQYVKFKGDTKGG